MTRLIDAWKLCEYANNLKDKCVDANDIMRFPAEDAVPVKHGRWVVDPEGMLHCSNCKELPTNRIVVNADLIYDMTPIKEKMKYCPSCGARMEQKE